MSDGRLGFEIQPSEVNPGGNARCRQDKRGSARHVHFVSSRRRHTRCSRDWSSDVCSSDLKKFLRDNLPKAIDDFWQSGRLAAERTLRTLARHGFAFSGKTCVEYGCGVGRITTGLSRGRKSVV